MLIKDAQIILNKGSTINKQFDTFLNILKLYTTLENIQSWLNPNEIVKDLHQELFDNNEDLKKGVFLTSIPIPNTTINYIQRINKWTEKANLNGQ